MQQRSGRVFYSAPSAFTGRRSLYLLGLNPGGSPVSQVDETIGADLESWGGRSPRWSAYIDEGWAGAPAGTHGVQPRVRYLFDRLQLDLRDIPASNVLFVRTSNEAALAGEKRSLLEECWPVHQAVIDTLHVSTVLCLGNTAGSWVRTMLDANEEAGCSVESNSRGWSSVAHVNGGCMCVVTLTHPARADWRNPAADPSSLVRTMLER